jgi:hypothetical protein
MNHYFLLGLMAALSFFSFGLKLNIFPGSPSDWLGYHSKGARRNEDTWFEANVYAGRALMFQSCMLLILLLINYNYFFRDHKLLISIGVFIPVSCTLIFVLTERRMKRIFFKDGKRRPRF